MMTTVMKKRLCWAFVLWPLIGLADVQPVALFTDHMVIQRETQAPVWGTGDAGEPVTVKGSWGKSAQTTVGEDGTWRVRLETPKAGGPHTLTIQGKNTIEIQDVLSGEVWFCSGQSNMEWVLQQLTKVVKNRTAEEDGLAAQYIQNEIETAADDQLRQFSVEKVVSPFESRDSLKGGWKASASANNKDFSATAYFFGRELRKQLGVPVRLIKCAWGGTRVEAWIPVDGNETDAEMADYYQAEQSALKRRISNWNPEREKVRYVAALTKWKTKKKGRKPKMAVKPELSPQNLSTLFNGMVNPVVPYAIRGAIWYQGNPMPRTTRICTKNISRR